MSDQNAKLNLKSQTERDRTISKLSLYVKSKLNKNFTLNQDVKSRMQFYSRYLTAKNITYQSYSC